MSADIKHDFGLQPMEKILREHQLKAHDLVAASTEQLTHKKIAQATKGRRLTLRTKLKILKALNSITGKNYILTDLFNYS